jgi:hypothetical protein
VQISFSQQTDLCMYTHFYYRRAKSQYFVMALRKASKTSAEISRQGSDNVSNTSPRSVDSIRTWSYISEVLQSDLVNCSDDSSDNKKDDMTTKYKIVIQAEMQKVAARPHLLPYYEMIRWVLDHVDIPTRTIINEKKVIVGTFRPKNLQAMYKVPPTSKFTYNAEFLEDFKHKKCEQYGKRLSDLIKDWVSHLANFRENSNGFYSISSLEPQFKYIEMMTCRLYGREDTTHFSSHGCL